MHSRCAIREECAITVRILIQIVLKTQEKPGTDEIFWHRRDICRRPLLGDLFENPLGLNGFEFI